MRLHHHRGRRLGPAALAVRWGTIEFGSMVDGLFRAHGHLIWSIICMFFRLLAECDMEMGQNRFSIIMQSTNDKSTNSSTPSRDNAIQPHDISICHNMSAAVPVADVYLMLLRLMRGLSVHTNCNRIRRPVGQPRNQFFFLFS